MLCGVFSINSSNFGKKGVSRVRIKLASLFRFYKKNKIPFYSCFCGRGKFY